MKNIHILQKNVLNQLGVDHYGKTPTQIKIEEYLINKNIYITSDEEIKDGDFAYDSTSKTIVKVDFIKDRGGEVLIAGVHSINLDDNYTDLLSNFKKIILTTDQDLIKDGVQAIDDDFLEWFVKNPSCESVKFWRFHGINTSIAEVNAISGDGSLNWQGRGDLRDYKIIIPQEGMNCWSGKKGVEGWPGKEEPKQETLEEVAEKQHNYASYEAFIRGAKWQQERMYSYEEVLEQLNLLYSMKNSLVDTFTDENDYITMKWFEQFKKK
jgi:hypothetical protein